MHFWCRVKLRQPSELVVDFIIYLANLIVAVEVYSEPILRDRGLKLWIPMYVSSNCLQLYKKDGTLADNPLSYRYRIIWFLQQN